MMMDRIRIISSCGLLFLACSAVATPPKGSGIPLYGLASDLKCDHNGKNCQSNSWLANIINYNKTAAHLTYLYPNYPYIDFLVYFDPTSKSAPSLNKMVDSSCAGTWPIFMTYNVYQREHTAPYKNTCYAPGSAANAAYNPDKNYQVMPTFSFDSTIIAAANKCYTNSPYTFKGNCSIPCPATAIAGQPLPASCKNSQMKIGTQDQQQLLTLFKNTGALVGMQIAADPSAQGASFDIEGPPMAPPLAQAFYSGVISTIKNKYIGVWRGVNIFGRASNNNIVSKTFQNLAQHNGFMILSMYDIGPTAGTVTGYNIGGGLQVAEPPQWYAGQPVAQIVSSHDYGSVSGWSTFELMLFGKPIGTGQDTIYDCHAKDMLPSSKTTLFNGCTGSVSFMQRMKELNINIPFQVGLPAIASTSEWITAVAWGDSQTIKGLAANAAGTNPAIATKQWLTTANCPKKLNIPGKSCLVLKYNSKLSSDNYDQSRYFYGAENKLGALLILKKYLTNPPNAWIGDYMKQNFMGLYIYGVKAKNFDQENCQYQLLGKGKKVCFGNYTTSKLFINIITNNTWSTIQYFYKNLSKKH